MARSARSKKTKGIGKHANIPSYHQSLSLDEDPTDETVVTPFLDIYLGPGIKGRRSRRLRRPHKDSNRHAEGVYPEEFGVSAPPKAPRDVRDKTLKGPPFYFNIYIRHDQTSIPHLIINSLILSTRSRTVPV